MSSRLHLSLSRPARAALTLWLIAALLWAPIWGQSHGIAHQLRQAAAPAAVAAPVLVEQDQGHTPGSALCQVLDHLGHVSALTAWPLAMALGGLPSSVPVLATWCAVALRPLWAAPARAPPSRT